MEHVEDEAIYKELDDRLVRAATTASSLEAEHDSGNINKTQSKATPNESSSQGTDSGGGPRCQDTMGILLLRLGLGECLNFPMIYYSQETKTTQALGIDSLKRRVKKLEKKQRIKTHKLKRLYKHCKFATTDNAAATMTIDEVTLAQAIMDIKSTKPKAKWIVLQKPSESRTTTIKFSSKKSHDKGKAIMIEEHVKLKKKYQIMIDEEVALKLQAGFDKEQRLSSEKAQQEEEANIDLIETWDDVQAKINDDYQLAERLQNCLTKALKRANTFVDYRTELVEESSNKAKAKVIEGSSKRARTKLEQESSKKQKIDDDKETTQLKQLVKIIPNEEGVAIDAIPLAVKPPSIVD
uniref:Uncharacterized protein n=1 Tax=Tanacetum cinerariifolium TaxID=118510 RepID=A0A699HVF5_TANCI|nr:hypothetical protein [Tanacetum cinerariifolium]